MCDRLTVWMIFLLSVSFILALALGIFMVTYTVATAVFSIQALVVGSDVYTLSTNPTDNCQYYRVGTWLIVFGSLGLFLFVTTLVCCPLAPLSSNPALQALPLTFVGIIVATELAWVFYGTWIVYDSGSNLDCRISLQNVFDTIVKWMFWGFIAMAATSLLLICCLCPVLVRSDVWKDVAEQADSQAASNADVESPGPRSSAKADTTTTLGPPQVVVTPQPGVPVAT